MNKVYYVPGEHWSTGHQLRSTNGNEVRTLTNILQYIHIHTHTHTHTYTKHLDLSHAEIVLKFYIVDEIIYLLTGKKFYK